MKSRFHVTLNKGHGFTDGAGRLAFIVFETDTFQTVGQVSRALNDGETVSGFRLFTVNRPPEAHILRREQVAISKDIVRSIAKSRWKFVEAEA